MLDHTEQSKQNLVSVDKDSQIQVMVNSTAGDEVVIDLGRVLHNMGAKSGVYIWVLLLCLAVGVCAALLHYQLTKPFLTVSSVVTLDYSVPREDGTGYKHVEDLTAPDGKELDLSQITSSYVLQTALNGLELSQPVTLPNLRNNITIDRILTEDSRRKQEVASNMIEDKNTGAYNQVQDIKLTYVNRFVVSLTNGFGDEDSRTKLELTDDELRLLLDRILDSYNAYLVTTYADVKLPDDEISIIDVENLDILESLDLLRSATTNLYNFIDDKSSAVKSCRSWETGLSLNDLLTKLVSIRENNVEYLYSYAYTNSIVVDRKTMLTNYQFELRNLQTDLSVVNENIRTNQEILDSYVNDEIYVTMQESDTAKTTRTNTDYYNRLIVQQAYNYQEVARLGTEISDLEDKIEALQTVTEAASIDEARAELDTAVGLMQDIYTQIRDQFAEIIASPTYTTYAEHSVSQGKTKNFLAASSKKMILGAAAGLVVACGLWFCSALLPELMGDKEDEKRKEAATA